MRCPRRLTADVGGGLSLMECLWGKENNGYLTKSGFTKLYRRYKLYYCLKNPFTEEAWPSNPQRTTNWYFESDP